MIINHCICEIYLELHIAALLGDFAELMTLFCNLSLNRFVMMFTVLHNTGFSGFVHYGYVMYILINKQNMERYIETCT